MANTITKRQLSEIGLISIGLCLIFICTQSSVFPWVWIGLTATLITLLIPKALYPIAWLWFRLGDWLAGITSTIVLTVVFVVFVIPVAYLKKWFGQDSLQLNRFKKGTASVFRSRNHTFTQSDLKYPF
ncbi:MAG: SxtJ family membrane protein [Siphonobacter sp.]